MYRLDGFQLVQAVKQSGIPMFKTYQQELQVAYVYNRYMAELKANKMLDFDDLLHHCLALLKNHPEVSEFSLPSVIG